MTQRWPWEMRVVTTSKAVVDSFVSQKHYSRRPSIFWAGFALLEGEKIAGIVVYGQPSPPIQRSAFVNRDFKLYELSRLVVQTRTKNAASFLIANSLKMLEKPSAVVSYADSEWNHCGIVYQATNWLYTGATVSHDHAYLVNGERLHPTTIRDRFGVTNPKQWARENGVQTLKPLPKHRYFFFNGDKRQRRNMKEKLAYEVIKEYPKCDQNRYDDGPPLDVSL